MRATAKVQMFVRHSTRSTYGQSLETKDNKQDVCSTAQFLSCVCGLSTFKRLIDWSQERNAQLEDGGQTSMNVLTMLTGSKPRPKSRPRKLMQYSICRKAFTVYKNSITSSNDVVSNTFTRTRSSCHFELRRLHLKKTICSELNERVLCRLY